MLIDPRVPDFTKEQPVKIAKVCERFGVSRKTVEKWFGNGLEAGKLGGIIFTTWEAVQRFAMPAVIDPEPSAATRRRQSSYAKKQADDAREYFGVK